VTVSDHAPCRRFRGHDGIATVTGLVLLFAFTSVGVIWLARDVNRKVSNRSAAHSIAFQAARSGAQALGPGELRDGGRPSIDEDRAVASAHATAAELFDGFAVDGKVVRVAVSADLVEVEIRIVDPAGDVTGIGAARSAVAP
jgi:hypothetical protein